MIFDKTGTLTKGQPSVTDVVQASGRRAGLSPAPTPDDLLRLAAAAEKSSEHPLGEAILREASEALIAELPARDRPPVMMMALHIWALSHGIASLFGRGDAGRRTLPMTAEELLESQMLI